MKQKENVKEEVKEEAGEKQQKNNFAQGSIVVNILKLAVPMTLAQLINVLYNIVDRLYIGQLKDEATISLTGLGLCLPIISIVIAFANLFGMGGAPLCSIERGRGNNEEAEAIMGNSFAMMVVVGVILTVVGLVFKRPMLYLFGASDATIGYADSYITIYLMGNIFVMTGLGMNSFINSQGFGTIGMMTVLLGAVANIILDPVFIFFFHMSVRGAALATILSQLISAIMYNAMLQKTGGDLYVGIMTVINTVREVISMPVQGITHSSQPVMGYNYGAKEYGRVKKAIVFVSAVSVLYTLGVWSLVHAFPEFFIRIFNRTGDLVEAGIPAMRIYFFGFFMMAFQFAGQAIFVGLGKAKNAVFFSIFRKVIIVIPLIIILPSMFHMGTDGILMAEPVSNFIGGTACFVTMLCTVWPELTKGERDKNK